MKNPLHETALEYFRQISLIPRGSGNEAKISQFLADEGHRLGLEVYRDKSHNVLIKKPGRAGADAVILQTHMDMVCDKIAGSSHNFETDSIIIEEKDGFITSGGETTLGADNGAGMALALAVLAADSSTARPIEALFTTEEETGMYGAIDFDRSRLSGKSFINLDSEEFGKITVGCAGSADIEITASLIRATLNAGDSHYTLLISGLTGGHSGTDIHKPLANANMVLCRVLDDLNEEIFQGSLTVASISGGVRRNIITREAEAQIAFDKTREQEVRRRVELLLQELCREFPLDKGFLLELSPALPDTSENPQSAANIAPFLQYIKNAPQGALSYSPDMDQSVQSSCNLGVVSSDINTVRFLFLARAMKQDSLDEVVASFKNLAADSGMECKITERTPPWPVKRSLLQQHAERVYELMYNKPPRILAIHAGLECAVFAQKMPDCDFIAIGPTIKGAHTPQERMELTSLYDCCDFLQELLK